MSNQMYWLKLIGSYIALWLVALLDPLHTVVMAGLAAVFITLRLTREKYEE